MMKDPQEVNAQEEGAKEETPGTPPTEATA